MKARLFFSIFSSSLSSIIFNFITQKTTIYALSEFLKYFQLPHVFNN